MATIDFPDISSDAGFFWELVSNTTEYRSDLNNAVQNARLQGDQWRGSLAYTNRSELEGRTMKAFLTRLGGQSGRFRMTPPDLNQLGTRAGTGLIDGAGQTGSVINTKGWTISQVALFQPGDYVEFNGELKMIVELAVSDSGGLSSLTISPPIRKATNDNDTVEVNDPQAIFMLDGNGQAGWDTASNFITGATITMVEDVT